MTQPLGFCLYLRGILDANKASGINPSVGLNEAKTKLVKDKLHTVFTHVIDPSYPSHLQTALQQAHSGQNPSGNATSVPQQTTGRQSPRSPGTGGLEVMC